MRPIHRTGPYVAPPRIIRTCSSAMEFRPKNAHGNATPPDCTGRVLPCPLGFSALGSSQSSRLRMRHEPWRLGTALVGVLLVCAFHVDSAPFRLYISDHHTGPPAGLKAAALGSNVEVRRAFTIVHLPDRFPPDVPGLIGR